ncbi:MAG: hypothetical protein ACI4J5_09550 [Oscillospiraceae bacterium]
MSEEKVKGRFIGRIVLTVCFIICIAALIMSMYFGGQAKTVNECYTAVIRESSSDLTELFADEGAGSSAWEALSEEYSSMQSRFEFEDNSIMHVRINFKGRRQSSLAEGDFLYTVTYYDDNVHDYTTEQRTMKLVREGTKWKIASADIQ